MPPDPPRSSELSGNKHISIDWDHSTFKIHDKVSNNNIRLCAHGWHRVSNSDTRRAGPPHIRTLTLPLLKRRLTNSGPVTPRHEQSLPVTRIPYRHQYKQNITWIPVHNVTTANPVFPPQPAPRVSGSARMKLQVNVISERKRLRGSGASANEIAITVTILVLVGLGRTGWPL